MAGEDEPELVSPPPTLLLEVRSKLADATTGAVVVEMGEEKGYRGGW